MRNPDVPALEDCLIEATRASVDLKDTLRQEVAYSDRTCQLENRNQWGTIGVNATACAVDCHRLAEAVDKARGVSVDARKQAIDLYCLWSNGARIEAVRQIKLLSPWRAAIVAQYFCQLFTDCEQKDAFKRMLMQGEVD